VKIFKLAAALIGIVFTILLLPDSTQPQPVQAGPVANPAACAPTCQLWLPIIAKPNLLQISNIEFTQAIQTTTNAVPLVANRPTLARITFAINGGSPIGGISVQLHALRNGVELPGSPVSNSTAFTAPVSPNRANLNDTLNFWLPSGWLSAPVNMYAVMIGGGSSRYPTSGTVALSFSTTPLLTIVVVPYQATIGGVVRAPAAPYDWLGPLIYQTYPLAQAPSIVVHSTRVMGSYASAGSTFYNDVLNDVTSLHNAEDSLTSNKEYYALVNVDCGSGCISGVGWVNSGKSVPLFSAVGFDGFGSRSCPGNPHCFGPETSVHEIGHTMGRNHTPSIAGDGNCAGVPSGLDPNYPVPTGHLDELGFNIQTSSLMNALVDYDFMGYCDPVWISKYTYSAIFGFRGSSAAMPAPPQASQDVFAVSGWMDNGQFKVSAPFSLNAPLTPDDPQGEYRLDVYDSANQLLHSQRFNLQATDHSMQGFHLNIPSNPGASCMTISRGSRLIFEQQASANLSVGFTTNQLAQSDSTGLSWSASGAQKYMVRVSHDGGATWQVLGMNLSEPQFKLDAQTIAGGDVLVEVQASDGVRVVKQQTQARFAKHAPSARISSANLKTVKVGQPFVLTATAFDLEDGALIGDAVQWSSDRDGALGSGTTLLLERGLSAGTHTLTVSVTDSDGNIVTDQMVVEAQ
jgi:hypothetical protein